MPAPGRGGRGRAVLMRGGAELSATTNQRAGVGWLPNGGRGGAVTPPPGASPPRPRRLLRARPRASERSNLRANGAKSGAERPERASEARRGRRQAAEHAPLSPLSTLGAARAAPGECAIGRGAPQLPGPSGGRAAAMPAPAPRLAATAHTLGRGFGCGLLGSAGRWGTPGFCPLGRSCCLLSDKTIVCLGKEGVFFGGDDGAGQRRGGGGAPRPLSRAQKMTAWVARSSHPFSTPKSLKIKNPLQALAPPRLHFDSL